MIRYIWCLECTAGSFFEAETDIVRRGRVTREAVSCDGCREPLAIGDDAFAVTFCDDWRDYRPWEHEYLSMPNDRVRPKDERPATSPYQEDVEGRSSEPAPAKVTSHDNACPIISTYTRRQAIEDGVLIDVSQVAQEAGFTIPVALTNEVWSRYVRVPLGVEGQDVQGRLWDVLSVLRMAIRCGDNGGQSEIRYRLHVRNDNRDVTPPLVELKAVCGPNDDGSPCVTVLVPGED